MEPTHLATGALTLLFPRTRNLAEVDDDCPAAPPRGSCPRCWVVKVKCKRSPGLPCQACIAHQIPQSLCDIDRITRYKPFEKWQNGLYERQFTDVTGTMPGAYETATLQHYTDGPTLEVNCCPFSPIRKNQFYVCKKDRIGWHPAKTTAYCLATTELDLKTYVKSCMKSTIAESCRAKSPTSFMFILAGWTGGPLIYQCFELYTTLVLLQRGWRLRQPALGMSSIQDESSAWHGAMPAPRMVQNQLGHLLELRMVELDAEILRALHKLIAKRHILNWLEVTLAIFLLLHVRELDAARIIYWKRYRDTGGFWIHPTKPAALINEEVFSCKALLWHYHCAYPQQPLAFNWDAPTSRQKLEEDEKLINSMRYLQKFVSALREGSLIGRKAADLYVDGKPESVAFSISSLIFENREDGFEAGAFA
ncbi:hypothetical protein FJTKL_08824 [Diaporthe vaccinii]|uniref:Zn(2)-C6 fungal-type domain-containing protein n=1 Tax=Diaporthe vaccinii TaxID=105482 RepID=A0ABR4EPP4_9PEZI